MRHGCGPLHHTVSSEVILLLLSVFLTLKTQTLSINLYLTAYILLFSKVNVSFNAKQNYKQKNMKNVVITLKKFH